MSHMFRLTALTASADVQEMDDYETGDLVQIEDDPEQAKARQQVSCRRL